MHTWATLFVYETCIFFSLCRASRASYIETTIGRFLMIEKAQVAQMLRTDAMVSRPYKKTTQKQQQEDSLLSKKFKHTTIRHEPQVPQSCLL
jgi:uncharacterized lipoprotein YmbA